MANPPSPAGIPHIDKVEHAVAFIIMSGWFALLYPKANWRLLGIMLVFAATTEWLQSLTGYRDADAFDWLADSTGAVIAIVAVRMFFQDTFERISQLVLKSS